MKKNLAIWALTFSTLLISAITQAQDKMNLSLLPMMKVSVDSVRTHGAYVMGYKDGKVVASKMEKEGIEYEEVNRNIGRFSAIKDKDGTSIEFMPSRTEQGGKVDTVTVLQFGDARFEVQKGIENGAYAMSIGKGREH